MACIADLPVELLANIFLLAVFACDGVPDLRDAPWNISQVCQLWRSITLDDNDGRLWAHLRLFRVDGLCYEDGDGEQRLIGPDGGLRLLRIWLTRSRDALLHYFVDDLTSYSRQALHLLLDHQDRWKNMGMHVSGWNFQRRIRLMSLLATKALLVEIDTKESDESNDGDASHSHEFEAPSGKSDDGPLFVFPPSAKAAHAIAPHLTKLQLIFEYKRHRYLRLFTMPLLQQCPVLEHLEIDFIPESEHILDEAHASNLTLPYLRSLHFFTKYNSCTYFLRRLDVPCLERLDVETRSIYVDGAPRRTVDDLLEVVRKTASTLRYLRFIHDTDFNFYHELFPLIQGTINQLDVPYAGRVLEYIAIAGGSGDLAVFPNLQVLAVTLDGSSAEECVDLLKQLMVSLVSYPRFRFVATPMLLEYGRDEILGRFCREGKLRPWDALDESHIEG